MNRKHTGNYIITSGVGERVRAFVPSPLPPVPPLALSSADQDMLDHANRSLGRLDAFASLLPEIAIFLHFYVRKEAVLSSQIEGSQTTISDLLVFENPSSFKPNIDVVATDDVREVSNYVRAMQHGLARLKAGYPVRLQLLRELHGILFSSGRGSHKKPGDFRTVQNWIGGSRPSNARFVPPPANELPSSLGELEKFINDVPTKTPALLKAALAHVQFEMIHLFLDGNGRIGRLLVPLVLMADGALASPALYISLYFKEHREGYYDLLDRVRRDGDWEAWIRFFAEAVLAASDQAALATTSVLDLFAADRKRIARLGRSSANILAVHELFTKRMIATIPEASKVLKLSMPTTTSAFAALEELKIAEELTDKKRDWIFRYRKYYRILAEGAQPIL